MIDQQQITSVIEFTDGSREPARDWPEWGAAVGKLADALEAEGVTADRTVPLEMPAHGADGWMVTRGSVSFRCLYQWAMLGTAADPTPRFIGRVDVAYTPPTSST